MGAGKSTVARELVRQGYKVGIIDLTDGEPTPLSTSPEVRLEEAKQDLDQSETELREFKQKEKITGPDENDPLSAMSLIRLNDEYFAARIKRMGVESRIAALRKARAANKGSAPIQSLEQEVHKQMRETLTKEYLDTQMQLKDLSSATAPSTRTLSP